MATEVTQRPFTVDEYHRMAEAAIFSEDDRVELIDGMIVEMSPLGSRHIACAIRLERFFWRSSQQDIIVSTQNALQLDIASEPQPDVAILRYRSDDYSNSLPSAEDVLLLIEVSDSSLTFDRNTKAPLYARAGIPEMWIVDVAHQRIDVHSNPANGRYTSVRVYERGETLSSPTIRWLSVDVNQIVD